MNADKVMVRVASALAQCGLEAVLIGNAAAALHGAPVTTLDLDFLFRKTPANLAKLKKLADLMGGQIFRPYYPASGLYRLSNDETGLQLDFMSVVHGIRSFASLRSRAESVRFGQHTLWVASLEDIIRSKAAANRPRDRAVLEILQLTLREKGKKK